eukprot:GFYU01010611.1.p1 GENE.GFYU01010611.1~~GFYU01010611.1.p1  ORF type:complete len:1138 (+),score=425.76 GFYU01010611.1:162-3575(+)
MKGRTLSLLVLAIAALVGHVAATPGLMSRLKHYEVVHIERPETFQTLGASGSSVTTHPDNHHFEFAFDGVNYEVSMKKRMDLFHTEYKNIKLYLDGSKEESRTVENCYYSGSLAGHDGAIVSMSTCSGIDGLVRTKSEFLYVEPAARHGISDDANDHIVYRMSDLEGTEGLACGNGRSNLRGPSHNDLFKGHLGRGLVEVSDFEVDINAATKFVIPEKQSDHGRRLNSGTKHVELLIVNDKSRLDHHGGDSEAMSDSTIAIVNHVKAYYEAADFDYAINVVLVAQIVFADGDPYTPEKFATNQEEVDVDSLIHLFHEWRVQKIEDDTLPSHDNGHLFSAFDFSETTIGYAGVSAMCAVSRSGGINQCTYNDGFNAGIVAHEMGHNFGMHHDNSPSPKTDSACEANFLMSPYANAGDTWSSCSADWINTFFEDDYNDNWRGTSMCLENVPTRGSGTPHCGNGLVEEGEECDCGTSGCSDDPCCNPSNCTLKDGASCSAMEPCCTDQCNFAGSDVTCRSASGACDAAETCSGDSGSCPSNHFKPTGTTCSNGLNDSGACYAGACFSHVAQCAALQKYYADLDGTCPSADADDGDNACKAIYCSASSQGNSCFSMRNNEGKIQVQDGTPCDVGKQCKDGTCVTPAVLDPQNHVTPTPDDNNNGDVCHHHTVKVIVKVEQYGTEIGWSIANLHNAQHGVYEEKGTYEQDMCASPGQYTFKATDSYGDGWHGGWFKVLVDGHVVIEETEVEGASKEVVFSIQARCAEDGEWPSVVGGHTEEKDCGDGYEGKISRECTYEGVYQDVVNTCVRVCAGEGEWPKTDASNTATLHCAEGEVGQRTRACTESGWEDEVSTCAPENSGGGGGGECKLHNMVVSIHAVKYPKEISWSLDGIDGAKGGPYDDPGTYKHEYCVAPGSYKMHAEDSYGDGWHGGWFMIIVDGDKVIPETEVAASEEIVEFTVSNDGGGSECPSGKQPVEIDLNIDDKEVTYVGITISHSTGAVFETSVAQHGSSIHKTCLDPGSYTIHAYGDGWAAGHFIVKSHSKKLSESGVQEDGVSYFSKSFVLTNPDPVSEAVCVAEHSAGTCTPCQRTSGGDDPCESSSFCCPNTYVCQPRDNSGCYVSQIDAAVVLRDQGKLPRVC